MSHSPTTKTRPCSRSAPSPLPSSSLGPLRLRQLLRQLLLPLQLQLQPQLLLEVQRQLLEVQRQLLVVAVVEQGLLLGV